MPSPSGSPKKDVTLRCSPWTLKQMWGVLEWAFQDEPFPSKALCAIHCLNPTHQCLCATWRPAAVTCNLQHTALLQQTRVMPSTMVHHTSPRAFHPPQFQGTSAVTRWLLGGFSQPSTAPLGPGPGCAEPFGTQGGLSPQPSCALGFPGMD